MTLLQIVVLLFIAFVACIDACAPVAAPKVRVLKWATGASTKSRTRMFANRLLRTSDVDVVVGGGGGEEERGGLSIPVADKIKSALTSSKISPEKLQKWLDKGKSADIVFSRMGLTKIKVGLFYDSEFIRWLKYVDDLSAKHPEKGMSAISTLTAHYGDTALYEMLKFAKSWSSTQKAKDIAARLHKEQVQHWLATGQTPDDVIHFMQLERTSLGIPDFAAWVKYVDDFNAKYPENSVLMASTLTQHRYAGKVFNDAEALKAMYKDSSIGSIIQDDLMKFWLNHGKTPEAALKEIGLGKDIFYLSPYSTLLENPKFKIWTRYLHAYNARYSQQSTTMIETLTKTFGDNLVARMLYEAKRKPSTQNEATKLESALLEMWSKSGKSAEDVLNLLRPHPGDPEYEYAGVLVKYINVLFKKSPDETTSWLASLKTRFPERFVNQVFLLAMRFPSMENIAVTTQAAKIRDFLAKNESPNTVFKLLALDRAGDDILTDRVFQMWVKYVEDFNKNNPTRKESLYTTIRMHYGSLEAKIEAAMNNSKTENLAKLLEREQSKYKLDG